MTRVASDMTPLDDRALLDLWERALPLRWPAREALFAAQADGPAVSTVGAQRLRVLALHRRISGDALPLRCNCPGCGEDLGFEVDLGALAAALPPPPAPQDHALDVGGRTLRFRLPAPADIAAADTPDVDDFVARLLARCLHDDGAAGPLPPPLLGALAERM
jgi:hypothetical protein